MLFAAFIFFSCIFDERHPAALKNSDMARDAVERRYTWSNIKIERAKLKRSYVRTDISLTSK